MNRAQLEGGCATQSAGPLFRTKMRDTSLEAYDEIKGKLGRRQKAVLAVLEVYRVAACNQEIAWHLGWPINCVTGRVKELRDLGLVEDAGKRKYGKRNVHFWRARKCQ